MEHVFTELGYLRDTDVKAIKERLQGRSYMHFDIRYSSYAGNYTLVVGTSRPDTTEEELAHMFLAVAMTELASLARKTA